MRKVLVPIFCLIVGVLIAQVPQGINYQAIVRDGAGNPVTGGPAIPITVTIVNGSGNFVEIHNKAPNEFGLVNFVIGSLNTLDFQNFDFSVIPTTISVDADGNSLGAQTLQSVPFSLRTAVADSVAGVDLSSIGSADLWQASPAVIYNVLDKVGIGTNSPSVPLEVMGSGSAPATTGTSQTGSLRLSGLGTQIVLDFGIEDDINEMAWLQTGYSTNLASNTDLAINPNGGNVGIGKSDAVYTLDVAGNMGVDEYIYHNGDANTSLRFATDQMSIRVGGSTNVDVIPSHTTIFAEVPGQEPLSVIKRTDDPSVIESVMAVTNFNKNATNTGFGTGVTFYGTNGGLNNVEMAQIASEYVDPTEGDEATSLKFFTRDVGGPLTEQMILDQKGQLHLPAYTNATTRMLTISPTGSVGVSALPSGGDISAVIAGDGLIGGASSGSATLDVVAANGLTANANDLRLGGTLSQNTFISQGIYSFDINLNSTGDFAVQDAGVDKFVVRDNGNVGVGISLPSEELDVVGDVQVSGEYKYAAPKTRYLHLGPWDFQAKDGEQVEIHGGQGYFNFKPEPDAQDPSAFAPIRLPDGATITSVYFYYLDNSIDNFTFEIQRYSISGAATSFGSVSSTESAFSLASKTLAPTSALTISNFSYKYVIKVTSPVVNNTHRLYTVRITYTVDEAD